MNHSKQDDVILLLTVSFSKSDGTAHKPLSNAEWSRLAHWLRENDLQPKDLLDSTKYSLLPGWVEPERVAGLLGRGVALGLLKEKLARTGLWVLTRGSAAYPSLIKQRLGWKSPPVLFGCGDQSLLKCVGVAVVGSRNVDEANLQATIELAARAATQNIMVISGGARGVDQSAMLEALRQGGTATGILADGLLRATTSAKYREHISSGRLVLISPYHPETSFNVGNAMDRNKYIYCLSRAAIVVCCAHGKGGTWQGAQQNLKERWGVPLWFNRIDDYEANNPGPGGYPLPDDLDDLSILYDPAKFADEGMYWNLLGILERFASRVPLKASELFSQHGLQKTRQVNAWLKRGVGEGLIEKLDGPVRYKFRGYESRRGFSDNPTEHQARDTQVSPPQLRVATQPERQLALPGN